MQQADQCLPRPFLKDQQGMVKCLGVQGHRQHPSQGHPGMVLIRPEGFKEGPVVQPALGYEPWRYGWA